ncbi:hypothetical protein JTB14_035022 [Gonioctena quinquepunctata]|nr:hypothetical protein JTB14_035022 [Gonioctena quinquepunctata]
MLLVGQNFLMDQGTHGYRINEKVDTLAKEAVNLTTLATTQICLDDIIAANKVVQSGKTTILETTRQDTPGYTIQALVLLPQPFQEKPFQCTIGYNLGMDVTLPSWLELELLSPTYVKVAT